MMKLFQNCNVFSPQPLGRKDVLVAGNKIIALADRIDTPAGAPCEVINADGMTLIPGLIDGHVHIAGAGGEGGAATRTPELQISQMIEGGVTTVIGCLGTDGFTRSIEGVLMKAKAIRAEGLSCWIYTGSYQIPTPTLTGEVGRDIALIEEVIGVGEIAISDHRSSYPTTDELIRLTEHARVGGMLGGKAGIINIHLGDAYNPFTPLYAVVERTMLKLIQFLPTHCNRNDYTLVDAIEYAKKGGYIDITTSSYPYFPEYEVKPSKALVQCLEAGVKPENITFSSDACGSLPGFDENGNLIKLEMGLPSSNFRELMDCIHEEGLTFDQALPVLTSNTADILKLKNKGRIAPGKDADLVFLQGKEIVHVLGNGEFFMKSGKIVRKGSYE